MNNNFQICRSCGINKELKEFHKDCTKSLGYRNICKICYKQYTSRSDVREKRLKYHKEYDIKNKDKRIKYRLSTKEQASKRSKEHHLKSKYNLTAEGFEILKNKQNNRCLICSKDCNLVIDHNHRTGKIRGLLCKYCNTGLGMFKDNPLFLTQAVNYLTEKGNYS